MFLNLIIKIENEYKNILISKTGVPTCIDANVKREVTNY